MYTHTRAEAEAIARTTPITEAPTEALLAYHTAYSVWQTSYCPYALYDVCMELERRETPKPE